MSEKIKYFFTSDTHFSSERTLQLSKRPFKTILEHDETLINNRNFIVGKNDIVYHLGDFGDYYCNHYSNGKTILLLGNYEYETINNDFKGDFEEFKEYLIYTCGFYDVWEHDGYFNNGKDLFGIRMTHKPSNCEKDRFNLFGHVHKLSMVKRFGLNVGVDCHNFYPIDEEVVKFYRNAIINHYDEEVFM